MKIGEIFIQMGVKGDTKKLDQAIDKMEEAEKRTRRLIKYRKDLAKATSEDERKLIKENFAQQVKLDKMKAQNAAIKKQNAQWVGMVKSIGAYITGVTLAYKAMDVLINSMARANQQMITFQRTTGISFTSLNKYASANAAVNFNSSIEGTAQTMQRLSQNLWDIQMGRGDISPYQELAFVGGKAFNPMGMSVEQVIESVRDAIKGVNDLQATNIITRMGFAPDDLMMLRMSREEFEKINDLFLSPQKREEMYKNGLELKKIQLELQKIGQLLTIDFAKPFLTITKIIVKWWNGFYKVVLKPIFLGFKIMYESIKGIVQFSQVWIRAMANAFEFLKPILRIFREIYKIFEDVAMYYMGGESYFGDFIEGISEAADKFKDAFNFQPPEWAKKIVNWLDSRGGATEAHMTPINTNPLKQNTSNVNQSNSIVINSNQPTAGIVKDYTNNFVFPQGQLLSLAQ